MKKVSKKLVYDYIMGNDIPEEKLETLEDNQEFMLEVLKYTRDKEMFFFASDRLKEDVNFICKVANLFNTDYEFLEELYNSCDDEIVSFELACLLANLETNEDILKFRVLLHTLYLQFKIDVEATLMEESQHNLSIFGKGFVFAFEQFGNNETILTYIAKEMLNELFYENGEMTLTDFVHKNMQDVKTIYESKMKAYLVQFIQKYDASLSYYIGQHLEILEDLIKEILRIKRNWNYYITYVNERKVDIIFQIIESYMVDDYSSINYYAILASVASTLGVEDLFSEVEDYKDDVFYYNKSDANRAEIIRKKLYKQMKRLFANDYIESDTTDYNDTKQLKVIYFS